MRFALILCVVLSLSLAKSPTNKPCKQDDITGYWLTPYDKITGRNNIVEIFKKDGKYFAYMINFMDSLPSYKDSNNGNFALRERDVLGSVYIYNLERSEEFNYIKGRYYDFSNGKTFHLRAHLECENLVLIISVDNIGILGEKKLYKSLDFGDIKHYIKNKPEINFSGVD